MKKIETFIIIHDQDLIVEFENHNKFYNLFNYKYLFVGKKPTDKIESMDNVIICKNFDDNMEDYPQLTSYTGWYCLWKNNLIDTDYINLFEYDVLLHPDIQTHISNLYNQNVDMIGYIPFPIASPLFVKTPKYNEHILPVIEKLENLNLIEFFDKVLQENPNAHWASTSNTTFRKDVFEDYMKWFYPISEEIKNTTTCGHAHERSISFFSFIKNKKHIITNGLMKHLQLDSHKTQGHHVNLEVSYDKLFNNKF